MRLQMNAPYGLLKERIDHPILDRIHPEIYFSWQSLQEDLKEAERIAEALEKRGRSCTFHAPFIDLNIGAVDPLIREVSLGRIKALKPFMEVFRPDVVVVHGGYDPIRYDFDVGSWFDAARASMEELLRFFEGLSVIAVENVFDKNPHAIWSLLDEFRGEKVGFCFDPGHAFFLGNVPLRYWLDVLGEFLVEVHLHDNHGMSDEHLPMGEGAINFRELFGVFKSMEREPIYTLEVHREEHVDRALRGFERFYGATSP